MQTTVKELIAELRKYPSDMQVKVSSDKNIAGETVTATDVYLKTMNIDKYTDGRLHDDNPDGVTTLVIE